MRGGDAKTYIAARIRVEDRGYSSPCWVWQRSLTEKGYGRGPVPGFAGNSRVHRATYELYVGPIPEGLVIDHLCCVKACCNPDHLEAVTDEENRRRAAPSIAVARREAIVLCEHGAFRSYCKPCHAAYVRAWHAKRRSRREAA
jgi:hypothetical protein